MCGIAGMFGQVDPALLERMTRALTHRGPDGQGTTQIGHAGLGSTRLSLIDFEHGAQPIRDDAGRLVLVFNGEIYNHQSLRNQLGTLGYRFEGRCDTEALLRAYQAWGPACLEKLEGMYAFAVSDGDTLFLARDAFGIKPLLYTVVDGGRRLVFASEIKALLEDPAVPRALSRASLFESAAIGWPLNNRTFFAEIRQMPPGTTMTVSCRDDGTLRIETGTHTALRPLDLPDDEDALVEMFVEGLRASVREQMVADHPVGAFLSGGVDSSMLVALMVEASQEPVHTFTVSDWPDHPDVRVSRALAEVLGTQHHELRPPPEDQVHTLPASTSVLEVPGEFSIVETASPPMRRHVKATLCGDGADELFAGYSMHARPIQWFQHSALRYNLMVRTGKVLKSDCADAKAVLHHLQTDDVEVARERLYQFFQTSQLTHCHLAGWDLGSMAVGLEVRVPYLNTRLRDLAQALPWRWKVVEERRKVLARRAAARILPPAVADHIIRRPKLAAPLAFRDTYAALDRFAEATVPEAFRKDHPFWIFCPTPAAQVKLDTFIYLFLGHNGRVPEGFRLADLYTRHLDDLKDLLPIAIGEEAAAPQPVG